MDSAPHPVTRRYSFPTDVVLGSTREWPPVSRLWRPVSQCPSLLRLLQRAAMEPTTALCFGWAFPALLICRVLWVLGAISFLLTSSHQQPVLHSQQVSLALGCPFRSCGGSRRGGTAPPSQGPGDGPICSLILRKAVLQIWNRAGSQCTTDWKCLVHTGIWGHPWQAEQRWGAKFQVEFAGARQWAGQSATVRGAEMLRQEPESPRRRDR